MPTVKNSINSATVNHRRGYALQHHPRIGRVPPCHAVEPAHAVEFQDWICEEACLKPQTRGSTASIHPRRFPDFTNPVEAARAWADERAKPPSWAQATAQAAIAERDHAIKPGQIGSRREASALGLLSAENAVPSITPEQLGIGRSWKAAVWLLAPWVLDVFAPSKGITWSVLGRKLMEYSKELGYEVRQIDDERYGKINAYHAGVIEAFRMPGRYPGMMGRYRRPFCLNAMEIRCRLSPAFAGTRRVHDAGKAQGGRRTVSAIWRPCPKYGWSWLYRTAWVRSAGTGLKENLKVPNSNTKKARWGNTGPRRMKTCELFIKTLKTVCPQPGLPSRERCEYGRLFQGLAQD